LNLVQRAGHARRRKPHIVLERRHDVKVGAGPGVVRPGSLIGRIRAPRRRDSTAFSGAKEKAS